MYSTVLVSFNLHSSDKAIFYDILIPCIFVTVKILVLHFLSIVKLFWNFHKRYLITCSILSDVFRIRDWFAKTKSWKVKFAKANKYSIHSAVSTYVFSLLPRKIFPQTVSPVVSIVENCCLNSWIWIRKLPYIFFLYTYKKKRMYSLLLTYTISQMWLYHKERKINVCLPCNSIWHQLLSAVVCVL